MDKVKTVETLKRIRPEIDAALAEIAKKYGVKSLKLGRMTYDSSGSFKGSVEGVMEGGLSLDAQMYEAIREYEGLPPLGTSFDYKGSSYTITGANRTGTKIMAVPFNGKTYLFTRDGIKRMCGVAPKATLSAGRGGSVSVANLIPATAE